MKHNLKPDSLYQGFLSKKFRVNAEQLNKIDRYCAIIKEWSRRQNIVSRHDLDHLYEKHVMPSAFITSIIGGEKGAMIADIGSGSGFPGIIIKILLPQTMVHLIDSSRKKYLFLLELCEKIDIPCKVFNVRFEDLPRDVQILFDLIVSRAVAPLATLWAWSEKSLAPNGSLYVLKGGKIDIELQQLAKKNQTIEILRPDQEWQNSADVSENKFIVRVRRRHNHG